MRDSESESSVKERDEFVSVVHQFDVLRKTWRTRPTSGENPSASERCAHTSNGSNLYVYGGYDWLVQDHDDSLHKLDLDTLTWTKLPSPVESNPGKKSNAGLAFQMNMLVLFGGFGFPPINRHPSAEYVSNAKYFTDGRGWTNDLYTYPLSDGESLELCASVLLVCSM